MAFYDIISGLETQSVRINQEEIARLKQIMVAVELQKGDFFQEFGQWSTHMGIVTEGALYAYSLHDDGSEKVHDFYYPVEHAVVVDYKSYHKNEPSKVYIKCHEKCILYLVNLKEVRALYGQFPVFAQIESVIAKYNIKNAINKIEILQEDSNQIKIDKFRYYYSKVFHFFPYSYIASYLGIHRNTLNRLFKNR
ncbi:Crp/Fnr family transcriptional regulator [Myroides sp. DW712]|uniref:Crp/Fnr family transcriptional regulator n=1 Tax=Myroides sp. DW712 TaxID=3389800 RepID=UPI00397AE2A7